MAGDGGRTLGSYQLLSQLAVGGMAEIYIARTLGVGGFEKLVALKVIHPNFSADPDFVQMLVDEAKLSVQLQHANIVQTFDLGRVDEQYYIAMELVDGVDLYKLLRRASEHEIDFPFEVAAFIAAEVCTGLDYAHRKRDARGRPLKIVHRDVSPQNVLVSFDGEVKIVDFGIAKAAMRGQQTAAGVIKGKYYYMSPEQAWGDPIDARTDIFSAGILLYEMIVGQMLYMEDDLDKLLDVVRKAQIPSPTFSRANVPEELEAIVMRALKKRADDRWATAGEFAQGLQKFLHAHAPDFSRARLAAFVREVIGDDPTSQRRDPRSSTTHAAGMISAVEVRDENSLIFQLSALRRDDASGEREAPAPRRPDMPTNPGDFAENEATIVDTGDTLMARLGGTVGGEAGDNDATRPVGPALRRGTAAVPSGEFDLGAADPARDDAAAADADLDVPTLSGDDDDVPTSARPLPPDRQTRAVDAPPDDGDEMTPDVVDSPLAARPMRPTPIGVRHPNAPRAAAPASSRAPTVPLPPQERFDSPPSASGRPRAQPNAPAAPIDEHETNERMRPTMEMKRARVQSSAPPPTLPSFADEQSMAEATVSAKNARPPTTPSSPLPATARAMPAATAARPPSFPSTAEEPTRIPPAQPPPLDSGRFPGFDGGAAVDPSPASVLPFPSPLSEVGARLKPTPPRALYIVLAALVLAIIGVVLALAFSGGSDGRGTFTIVSVPAGAEVRLDGTASSQTTPLTLGDLDVRLSHHVRVSKSGYDVWESDVKFPSGERQVAVQAVLMPTVGTVEIVSTPPGAEAIVNGRIRGMTPTTVGDLPPNDDVVIELRLRGYKVAHKTVTWQGQRKVTVTIPLEKAK